MLEGNFLKLADPSRGRFRSLLFKSLQNFLIDAKARQDTIKRGAKVDFISWDERIAEAPSHLSIPVRALETLSPECAFDLRWAATVIERSLQRMREECEACGRRRAFDLIGHYLTGDGDGISYVNLAQKLGIAVPEVRRLLYQMRQRFRDLLRSEVAQTVETPEEIDAEIRYLCAALAAAKE
jgi:RNA polymerase sigma-70 factor (ECF subfamily)